MRAAQVMWLLLAGAALAAVPLVLAEDGDYGLGAGLLDDQEAGEYGLQAAAASWPGRDGLVDLERIRQLPRPDQNAVLLGQAQRLLKLLKEKAFTAKSRDSLRQTHNRKRSRSNSIRLNKRHCWDVADVCCMWNIC